MANLVQRGWLRNNGEYRTLTNVPRTDASGSPGRGTSRFTRVRDAIFAMKPRQQIAPLLAEFGARLTEINIDEDAELRALQFRCAGNFSGSAKGRQASRRSGPVSPATAQRRSLNSDRLLVRGRFHANSLVGNIAYAPFDAIVHRKNRRRAERLVVVGGHAEGGSQFFIKTTHAKKLVGIGGKLAAVVREKKLLVNCIPQAHKLAVHEDGGKNGHQVVVVGCSAELGAATIFLDARDAAGAAHNKPRARQGVHQFGGEIVR